MAFPLIPLFTAIGSMIAKPIERWQETKAVQHTAKIKRIQSGDDNAAEMDRMSVASRGWKDEYLLLLSTAPLVAIFIDPFLSGYNLSDGIRQSFITLNEMPEYYWYILGIIYIDTFGFRRMLRVAVEKWLNNKFGDNK